MERSIKLLAALLGVQVLLALGFGFSGSKLSARVAAEPLLMVKQEAVDRIIIEGPEQAKTMLAKRDGGWYLPEVGDFPADGKRVDGLLDRLVKLQVGAPVANTSGARARFRVSDDAYERRITLTQGDTKLATLYLGTTPGRGRIHARALDQEAVHSVELAMHEVPVKAAEWEDKTVLQIEKQEVVTVEVNGLRLERRSDEVLSGTEKKSDGPTPSAASPSWVAQGLANGKQLNPESADNLVGLLANLRFDEVLGRDAKDEYGLDEPVLELVLTRTGGVRQVYRLGKSSGIEGYVLEMSTRPEHFRLAEWNAKPLLEAARQETLTNDEEKVSTSEESSDVPTAGTTAAGG